MSSNNVKILQIILEGRHFSKNEIENAFNEVRHEKRIKRQIFALRNKIMFQRFIGGMAKAIAFIFLVLALLYLVFWVHEKSGAAALFVAAILFGIGLYAWKSTWHGISNMFGSIGNRLTHVFQNNPDQLAVSYFEELYAPNPDWGKMYKLLVPYITKHFQIDKYKKEWGQFIKEESIANIVRPYVQELKDIICCNLCKKELKVYKSRCLWKFDEEKIPCEFFSCPYCNMIICKDCAVRLDGFCKECQKRIMDQCTLCYFIEDPVIEIARATHGFSLIGGAERAPVHDYVRTDHKDSNDIVPIQFEWIVTGTYEEPIHKWSSREWGGQKEVPEDYESENIFHAKVVFNNIALKIKNKYFFLDPTPGVRDHT